MFKKYREILVDRKDLGEALLAIRKADRHWLSLRRDIDISNFGLCGWAKAPNCCFIQFYANDRNYWSVIRALKDNLVEILPVTTGY